MILVWFGNNPVKMLFNKIFSITKLVVVRMHSQALEVEAGDYNFILIHNQKEQGKVRPTYYSFRLWKHARETSAFCQIQQMQKYQYLVNSRN